MSGRDPSSIAALKKFARSLPGSDDNEAVIQEVSGGSHRAAMLIATSNLEDTLEAAIYKRFVSLNEGEYSQIFFGDSPLSTFSAKIRMGYALGIFGKVTRDHLISIQAIRNACAHSRKPISFDTPEVEAVIRRLTLPNKLHADDPFKPWSEEPTNDWRVIRCIFLIELRLNSETKMGMSDNVRAEVLP